MKKILQVQSLKKYFPIYGGLLSRVIGQVKAVDDVSFDINEGEILGLVGESGCGKTTVGRMTLRLLEPTSGKVLFEGTNLLSLKGKELAMIRPRMQIIFQDPYSSLNPRFTVERIIGEALSVHGLAQGSELRKKIEALMEKVGLSKMYLKRFPHEFSGGQRQRIGIARALAVQPEFLVCDEAIAALDVSIQAQVINLFMDLRTDLDLTYLFISHDLSVVEHISDRLVIMYLGRIVETAPTDELFDKPNHPYTSALLNEVPRLDHRGIDYEPVSGEIPSPLDPPPGCHFHPRCPHAMDRCKAEIPVLREIAPGRLSACHLNDG